MELNATEIAEGARGKVVRGNPDARATSYTIDSRRTEPDGCFFALQGARDGHDFVQDAGERGAVVAVVSRPVESGTDLVIVEVDETLPALASVARVARDRLGTAHVVGVTGSVGKTATKDLTAAAVGRRRLVHSSPASFNNEAGVPLTLLGAPEDTEIVVAEMGARFEGNIAELAALARPDVGVVTNIGMAHAEHLGGREGVARVKGELVEALPADGLAVLNADCDATPGLAARTSARVLRAGRAADADVRATGVELDDDLRPSFCLESPWGRADALVGLRGEHQVANAVLAAAVALALDVPIADVVAGLADVAAAAHRMQLIRTREGIVVLDDSYNSNPISAAAAVQALAAPAAAGAHRARSARCRHRRHARARSARGRRARRDRCARR